MTTILAILARWGLGERAQRVVAYGVVFAAAIALLWAVCAIWLHGHDRRVIDAHEATVETKVKRKTATAGAAAVEAANAAKSDVEAKNDEARDVARDSADPLRDGLISLRK